MVRLENVTKIYNRGQENQFEALHEVNLEIKSGELVAIMGKSGAGKSTLLNILGCIDNYDSGEYWFDNELIKDIKESKMAQIRNDKLGIVMQDYALVNDLTAIENVMLPLDFSGKRNSNKKQLCRDALAKVDMLDYEKNMVNKLSGGQKQRVAIARSVVNNPSLILADEPTGALDSENAVEIMKLFRRLNGEGVTIIIITHDIGVANQCDRIIEISDGKIQ